MTSENTINERRNWKAQTFPYDHYIPDETEECLYCLTEKQAELLRGIIEPIAWKTRWWSELGVDIETDEIENLRADITRRLIMSCCGDTIPVRYRYAGTVLQKSTDGGLTWEDAPDNDYRNNSVLWPTPQSLGLSSSKCQAADSVGATFRDKINAQIADDMAVTAIVGVIVTVLLTLLSAGSYALIAAQVAGIAAAIFGAGVATWKAAFTTDVWNDFRCIVYCHMTGDNSIDQAGIDAIIADIATEFTGIVAPTLQGYVSAAGVIGIQNMMRSNIGSGSADCTECPCFDGCLVEQWHAITSNPELGIFVSYGEDFIEMNCTGANSDGRYYMVIKTDDADNCCQPVEMEIVSGAFTLYNAGRNFCGEDPTPTGGIGVPNHVGAPDTFGCSNYLQYTSTTPFVAKLHFVACSE